MCVQFCIGVANAFLENVQRLQIEWYLQFPNYQLETLWKIIYAFYNLHFSGNANCRSMMLLDKVDKIGTQVCYQENVPLPYLNGGFETIYMTFRIPTQTFFGRTFGVMHIQGSTYLVLSCHLWTHSWPVVFRVLLGGPCQSIETQCHLWNVPCLKKVRGLTIFLEGKMRFRFNMQMNFIM